MKCFHYFLHNFSTFNDTKLLLTFGLRAVDFSCTSDQVWFVLFFNFCVKTYLLIIRTFYSWKFSQNRSGMLFANQFRNPFRNVFGNLFWNLFGILIRNLFENLFKQIQHDNKSTNWQNTYKLATQIKQNKYIRPHK